jgi:hypothetical protein
MKWEREKETKEKTGSRLNNTLACAECPQLFVAFSGC